MGFLKSIFGGGKKEEPTVAFDPVEVEDDKKKAKRLRTSQFLTPGGSAGEELQEGFVRRDTLFGN